MTKSHVGMGYELCPICGARHNETVLLDTRLKDSLERDNLTGYSLCPEHAALRAEYLALVECDNPPDNKSTLKVHEAHRTGTICHVRRGVAAQIFGQSFPDDLDMIFVDKDVITKIRAMQEKS